MKLPPLKMNLPPLKMNLPPLKMNLPPLNQQDLVAHSDLVVEPIEQTYFNAIESTREAEVAVPKVIDYCSYDSKKETNFVGIKNQGATCYLNSLLQTLYHISYFRKAVYHMPTTEIDAPTASIPLALQSLFYKLQYNDTSVTTNELTKSFGWNTYDSFVQHDVHELNRVLCEKLEDKMKGTVVEGTIQKLFEGHHINDIECINVDYKSTRKESFYDLQLDVKGCKDVYASFDKYVQVERLEGDNKYHAEGYDLQNAKKGVLFMDFPPVLQLQLKRFEYDFMRDTMVKINDRYEFPLQLDLDRENGKYLSPDSDKSVRNLYTLHSVLVHSGGAHGGHYCAFIRPNLSDQWYKFDDERVTRQDVKSALEDQYGGEEELPLNNPPSKFTKNSNAYMLVYIRESDMDKIIRDVDEDITEQIGNKQTPFQQFKTLEGISDIRDERDRKGTRDEGDRKGIRDEGDRNGIRDESDCNEMRVVIEGVTAMRLKKADKMASLDIIPSSLRNLKNRKQYESDASSPSSLRNVKLSESDGSLLERIKMGLEKLSVKAASRLDFWTKAGLSGDLTETEMCILFEVEVQDKRRSLLYYQLPQSIDTRSGISVKTPYAGCGFSLSQPHKYVVLAQRSRITVVNPTTGQRKKTTIAGRFTSEHTLYVMSSYSKKENKVRLLIFKKMITLMSESNMEYYAQWLGGRFERIGSRYDHYPTSNGISVDCYIYYGTLIFETCLLMRFDVDTKEFEVIRPPVGVDFGHHYLVDYKGILAIVINVGNGTVDLSLLGGPRHWIFKTIPIPDRGTSLDSMRFAGSLLNYPSILVFVPQSFAEEAFLFLYNDIEEQTKKVILHELGEVRKIGKVQVHLNFVRAT